MLSGSATNDAAPEPKCEEQQWQDYGEPEEPAASYEIGVRPGWYRGGMSHSQPDADHGYYFQPRNGDRDENQQCDQKSHRPISYDSNGLTPPDVLAHALRLINSIRFAFYWFSADDAPLDRSVLSPRVAR
jgi:hypothetical protein